MHAQTLLNINGRFQTNPTTTVNTALAFSHARIARYKEASSLKTVYVCVSETVFSSDALNVVFFFNYLKKNQPEG